MRDFAPVATLSTGELVVHPALPVRTLREFAALARPGQLNYASTGTGSVTHLEADRDVRHRRRNAHAAHSLQGHGAGPDRPDRRTGAVYIANGIAAVP
jgi:hypothetical protein